MYLKNTDGVDVPPDPAFFVSRTITPPSEASSPAETEVNFALAKYDRTSRLSAVSETIRSGSISGGAPVGSGVGPGVGVGVGVGVGAVAGSAVGSLEGSRVGSTVGSPAGSVAGSVACAVS